MSDDERRAGNDSDGDAPGVATTMTGAGGAGRDGGVRGDVQTARARGRQRRVGDNKK